MKSSHTLMNKCDRFALTKHTTKKDGTYYKIDLNLKHRYWTDETLLEEYDTILNNQNRFNKYGWRYDNEEESRAKYNWAVIKWNN